MNETSFKKLTKDEYRLFVDWINQHGHELYKNKIAYETRWNEKDFFFVKLCDESSYTLDKIMLDIDEKIGYNSPS